MIRLYCATGNSGKLREYREAAERAPVEVELLPGFKDVPPCEEDGATFEANAILKARYYAERAGSAELLLAEDSGLEVDALGGEPGVRSARYCGHHGDDEANNRRLLENLRGIENRAARYVCVIALVKGGTLLGAYRGTVEGRIIDEPRGSGGFGYDPYFYYPPLDATFAEMSAGDKFNVSHRGHAFRSMLRALLPGPTAARTRT